MRIHNPTGASRKFARTLTGFISVVTLIQVIAWGFACLISLPLVIVGAQCWIACLPRKKSPQAGRPRIGVVMPAHNEELVLAKSIASIQPQLSPDDKLVVVADNCSDQTAAIARQLGAEVVERFNTSLRGKGYALDAGIQYLADDPPDVLIILDADCQISSEALQSLAHQVMLTDRPAQAVYLMRSPETASPESAISVFAFLVKNQVRARAMHRLGLPVFLTGSGMAFPWATIAKCELATGEIVEDLVLGLALTRQGYGPRLCEAAEVISDLPNDPAVAVSQRTRWEHGYLRAITKYVPQLIGESLYRLNLPLFCVAVDLFVPPLSLLVIVALFTVCTLLILSTVTQDYGPFLIGLSASIFFAIGLSLAWLAFGRHFVPASRLVRIPIYVIRKIGMYCQFFSRPQTEWIKTNRG